MTSIKKPICVFVIAAPTAAGKTSLVEKLLMLRPELIRAITATSRAPREGEVHADQYYFYPDGEFDRKIKEGFFFEWASVHGKKYGLPHMEIERLFNSGKHPLFILDVQGVAHLREHLDKNTYTKIVDIFILPPSEAELITRLKKRGGESDEQIATRLETMRSEMTWANSFSHRVLNADFDTAVVDLLQIVDSAI